MQYARPTQELPPARSTVPERPPRQQLTRAGSGCAPRGLGLGSEGKEKLPPSSELIFTDLQLAGAHREAHKRWLALQPDPRTRWTIGRLLKGASAASWAPPPAQRTRRAAAAASSLCRLAAAGLTPYSLHQGHPPFTLLVCSAHASTQISAATCSVAPHMCRSASSLLLPLPLPPLLPLLPQRLALCPVHRPGRPLAGLRAVIDGAAGAAGLEQNESCIAAARHGLAALLCSTHSTAVGALLLPHWGGVVLPPDPARLQMRWVVEW